MPNPFSVLGPDFFGFILPWLFTFAIVYGLIVKANLFKDATKKVGVALAFVIAFFVTAVGGPQMAAFFSTLFAGSSMFLAGILVIILFLALVGVESQLQSTIVVVFLIIIGIVLFVMSSGGGFIGISLDSQTTTMIFWGAILLAVVYFVAYHGNGDKPAKKEG